MVRKSTILIKLVCFISVRFVVVNFAVIAVAIIKAYALGRTFKRHLEQLLKGRKINSPWLISLNLVQKVILI